MGGLFSYKARLALASVVNITTEQPNAVTCREMATFVSMATCHTCNKTTRHRGMNRDYLSTFYTPGSSSKHKTPMPANRTLSASKTKTPSKDKTPHRTPRSSSSTPGSKSSTTPSNKTPSKAKNWVVKRLSKILMREDKPDSNKGSLKDFLSSL